MDAKEDKLKTNFMTFFIFFYENFASFAVKFSLAFHNWQLGLNSK